MTPRGSAQVQGLDGAKSHGAHIVTVGELTLDEIVLEGEGSVRTQPGGGALYSAIGALAWGMPSEISATVGSDFPEELLNDLGVAGIDVSRVTRIPTKGLGIWLLYESDGFRHQVPKASGATFHSADEQRRSWTETTSDGIRGIHVAPQTSEAQVHEMERARARDLIATLDVMVEPFIDVSLYRSGEAFRGAAAILPNAEEVQLIWGDRPYLDLLDEINALADVDTLVVKNGAKGASLVIGGKVHEVPAVPVRCLDSTGAGDAFCGGFLAGLLETGEALEATIRGVVSASVLIEGGGPWAALSRVGLIDVASRRRDVLELMGRAL